MSTSWRLGRVLGFPVEINLSFVLLLAFVALGGFGGGGGIVAVASVLLVFAGVLLHELGHAVVARRLGVHVAGIELSFIGGAAKMAQIPRNPNQEIAIAAAGPAVSLMLGGAGFGLGIALQSSLLATIGWINVIIAAFNLIPALPMDGGRILRALLSRRMSFVRATDVSVQVAHVVAVGFGVLGLFGVYQLLVLAPLLWMMSSRERLIARMAPEPELAGLGNLGRFHRGPAARPRGPASGFAGLGDDLDGPHLRHFTIRQVGGRTVIVAID